MTAAAREARHWSLALQIAAQVPVEEPDAWIVLACVKDLMEEVFKNRDGSELALGENQLLFFPSDGKSPRRRRTSRGSPSAFPK